MSRRKLLLAAAVVLALLGTALVFLYVQGADKRAGSQYSTVQAYVAQTQINDGETGDAAATKMVLTSVPQAGVPQGAIASPQDVTGKMANSTIFPGEVVLSQQFSAPGDTSVLNIPKGDTAISINLTDTARVAGFVNPGSTVGIYYTGPDANQKQLTKLLLAPVSVLAVGSTTVTTTTTTADNGAQTTEQLPRTLMTLAVTQAQAQKIIFASSAGQLAFGLVNPQTNTNVRDPGSNADNLFK